jgi:hypothetical protein
MGRDAPTPPGRTRPKGDYEYISRVRHHAVWSSCIAAILCSCAPARLTVDSVKDPGFGFRPGPLHVVIRESKGAEEYVEGMDTVAAAVFRESGLAAEIAFDRYLDLEHRTPETLKSAGATGYVLVIRIVDLKFYSFNGARTVDKLVFQADMFDLADGKKVWKSVADVSRHKGLRPGDHERKYLQAMLAKAESDQVIQGLK